MEKEPKPSPEEQLQAQIERIQQEAEAEMAKIEEKRGKGEITDEEADQQIAEILRKSQEAQRRA